MCVWWLWYGTGYWPVQQCVIEESTDDTVWFCQQKAQTDSVLAPLLFKTQVTWDSSVWEHNVPRLSAPPITYWILVRDSWLRLYSFTRPTRGLSNQKLNFPSLAACNPLHTFLKPCNSHSHRGWLLPKDWFYGNGNCRLLCHVKDGWLTWFQS